MWHGIQWTGLFLAERSLVAIARPGRADVYRRLILPPFRESADPCVQVYVAAFDRVSPWPFSPYLEGSVLLKVRLGEQEGWYPLTMPVTGRVANWGGRRQGFPKYMADNIRLARTNSGWEGAVRHRGRFELGLSLASGLDRQITQWERAVAMQPPFERTAIYTFVPPGVGPRIRATRTHHLEPARVVTRVEGMVRVTLDASAPFGGLLAPDATFPGFYQQLELAMTLRHADAAAPGATQPFAEV